MDPSLILHSHRTARGHREVTRRGRQLVCSSEQWEQEQQETADPALRGGISVTVLSDRFIDIKAAAALLSRGGG